MGKPFGKEIEKVIDTYNWASNEPVDELRAELLVNVKKPLFIVGSGGSLSACHFAALMYQQRGTVAKAITPLEIYYSKNAFREANVAFISASGKNTDILFGFKTALQQEPNRMFTLCMSKDSPLSKLAKENSITSTYNFEIPSGKDGFLATNSLIGFFTIIYNALSLKKSGDKQRSLALDQNSGNVSIFLNKVTASSTFTILYGGWGQPVAIDIESKLAEAALGNVLLSDYRNFGHGRHHWFAKRKANSAIIALISPEEEKLANKTLGVLPNDIPTLRISTDKTDGLASIDLLIKSFELINHLGIIQNIDPGRPGVPEFGSDLYHLKYSSFYKIPKDNPTDREGLAISRKINGSAVDHLNDQEKKYWSNAYQNFKKSIETHKFGILLLDYDGTLCASKDRYTGITGELISILNKILDAGFIIGIATGRGKSVRVDLQKIVKKENWDKVIIGYYNCSDIGFLSNNELPNRNSEINSNLEKAYNIINNYKFQIDVKAELKPNQVTIEVQDKIQWSKVRASVIQLLINENLPNIQILESSHSMDIIDSVITSKLNIVDTCVELALNKRLSTNFLCIGDKGKWPGNDYQLLSAKYSLSVDETSPLAETCWNLSPPGIKNIEATINYLTGLIFNEDSLMIKIK